MTRADIIARIRRHFFRNYRGKKPASACLYWAQAAVDVFARMGVRAIVQSGTMEWPRVDPDQDDGVSPTHFSYVWEPDSLMTKHQLSHGNMPEMHVWIALPDEDPPQIVDLTTRYLVEQCRERLGMDWPGKMPPDFLWSSADDWPDHRIRYVPDMRACAIALQMLRATTGIRLDRLFAEGGVS